MTVTLDGTVDETVPEGTGGYENKAWTATFINLPKYKADGTTEIVYTIAETTGYNSYTASTTDPVTNGSTITNTQVATPVELTKIGDWTVDNKLAGVQFKVFSDENCTKQLVKDSTGKDIGVGGLIKTGSDGKASIGTFIAGTYYLQEVKTADGYNILSDVVEFTIKEDGSIEYKTGNQNFDGQGLSIYEVKEGDKVVGYGIYINNESGAALPYTGGSGTLPYTLGGIALIMASALMYGFRMRRRERRLN